MKNILLYTFFAVGTLVMGTACSDSFLDKAPDLNPNQDAIFGSSARLESGVLGVYYLAKNGYFLGGYCSNAGDNRTDDMVNYGNNGYTFRDAYSHSVAQSSLESIYTFQNGYLAVNAANTLIQGLEVTYKDNLPVDQQTANQYIQECKFIRALSFYYLSQLFGLPYAYDANAKNIPMRTEAVDGPGYNNLPASTISQVFAQILDDTKDCSALPVGYGKNGFDPTRASQASVHALRMRIYMCMGQWENAIAEAGQIEGFSLIDKIITMFDSPYACTAENIFSIPMTATDRSGTQSHPVGYLSSQAGNICCINDINGIYTEYGVAADARTAITHKETTAGGTTYTFVDKYDELGTRFEWIPIFRYGETLLNLAECYYNINDEGKAMECLKQVRTRSIAAEKDPIVSYDETGNELWAAIDKERRWELIGEGVRGYDIFRRAEDFRHPLADGSWEIVATPSDRTTYCWAYPLYETTVNGELNN